MSRHVDEQTLAAFREGLLPARKAARITAHLATCQRCAEVDAQLAAVTTILARTPAPPMPASLASRLDAALAAEIAWSAAASPSEAASSASAATPVDAASPAGTATPTGAPVPAGAASPGVPSHAGAPGPGEHAGRRGGTPGRGTVGRRAGAGRGRWWLSPRLAAAAAAVVIVAGGGYALAHVLSAGQTGTSASSSGTAPSRSAAARPAAPGLGPREFAPAGIPPPVVASGTDYRPGQLLTQVSTVLRRYAAPGSSPSGATPVPTASLAAFPHLRGCVALLAGRAPPRLVDIARYDGQLAAVIVVPGPGRAELQVWVVGRGCSAQDSSIIAHRSMPVPG